MRGDWIPFHKTKPSQIYLSQTLKQLQLHRSPMHHLKSSKMWTPKLEPNPKLTASSKSLNQNRKITNRSKPQAYCIIEIPKSKRKNHKSNQTPSLLHHHRDRSFPKSTSEIEAYHKEKKKPEESIVKSSVNEGTGGSYRRSDAKSWKPNEDRFGSKEIVKTKWKPCLNSCWVPEKHINYLQSSKDRQ
jgi:hypothetical protein